MALAQSPTLSALSRLRIEPLHDGLGGARHLEHVWVAQLRRLHLNRVLRTQSLALALRQLSAQRGFHLVGQCVDVAAGEDPSVDVAPREVLLHALAPELAPQLVHTRPRRKGLRVLDAVRVHGAQHLVIV